jgi:O-methyltransferase involved in polyketide biosynthesis
VLRDKASFTGAGRSASVVESAGEPWTFGIDPAALPAFLAERGLELIEDVGSVEYRARYMKPSGLHMKGYEFYRAAIASVGS